MQAEEYEQAVAQRALPAMALAYQLLDSMHPNPVSESGWLAFLQAMFETVREQSWQAAQIARDFYDAERQRQIPGVPVQPVMLPSLRFEDFVRDMEAVRKVASRPEFSTEVVAMRVARTVENSARRTIIRAVEDPDPALDQFAESQEDEAPEPTPEKPKKRGSTQSLIRGWARVPTGRETCGFCWMLASRGPVYSSSWAGGGRLKDSEIVSRTADGTMSSDDMNKWHTGCDCKIVPVFRLDDWPGKEKYEAAWQLWKDEIQNRYSGRSALNAYRRLIESGELQKILNNRSIAA